MAESEADSFPILCAACLGADKYVRMVKAPLNEACRLCTRPFTSFSWRMRGSARTTHCCRSCATVKNACQACLLDFDLGVSLSVRDAVLPETGRPATSAMNRRFQNELAEKAAERSSGYAKAPRSSSTLKRLRNRASPLPATKKSTIYVPLTDKSVIRDKCAPFGAIKSLRVVSHKNCAFVEFEDAEAAAKAVETLNEEGGMAVGWARIRRAPPPGIKPPPPPSEQQEQEQEPQPVEGEEKGHGHEEDDELAAVVAVPALRDAGAADFLFPSQRPAAAAYFEC